MPIRLSNRYLRRTTATVAASFTALAGLGLALPASAHAAPGCTTLSATVANSAGNPGGHVQATLCSSSSAPYSWSLNESYYNFVQDYQADGVAARAYIQSTGSINGPLAVDDTSTAGGADLGSWESTNTGTWVRVYVCLGTKYPGSTGARCASDYASA
ncbi:hypothetical protein [Streptomyces katsurahamanus]|uniref:Secreted protein n=1 Tax=Streptomyces katsurahamanus TaxID=2577098 RepID=A0ABW9NWI4_9ACTN|nr:hypothetical protein [Streptomyces katsurahamanus]MQS37685.1 hypothetical protein [Streptomyces katsurahamanus]